MNTFFPSSMSALGPQPPASRVAIITRTKDRPVLLARAFASVLAQTHRDWHLYLVNDGGDPEPVDRLVKLHSSAFAGRLTVKHHPKSLGMEAASNAALERAIGDLVIVHDDDDSWSPTFLEETARFLNAPENQKYAAVATNCTIVYERIKGNVVIEEERASWVGWRDRVDLRNMLSENSFPPICLLIRKRVVDLVGPFNASLPVLGDWDYNLRILMVGDIGVIDRPLANYHHRRATPGSDIYGNSVSAAKSKHIDYQVLYRNSMLRQLFAKEPGYAGLMHTLLSRMDTLERQTREKLDHMHWDAKQYENHSRDKLEQIHWEVLELHQRVAEAMGHLTALLDLLLPMRRELNTAMQPLLGLWQRVRPVRNAVSKLRGR